MRIAVDVTTCTSQRAGVGYYAAHLVDALVEAAAPTDDLVLLASGPIDAELARRWSGRLRAGKGVAHPLWLQTTAVRLLADERADAAVFPNYMVPLAAPCPTVPIVHDLAVLRRPHLFTLKKRLYTRAMLRRSIDAATVIGTVSNASRDDIVSLLGVDAARIQVLPGAPHPACGSKLARAPNDPRPFILVVGTLEPRKDLSTILRAFDRIAARVEHDLVVVGGRGWHDDLLVRELRARIPGGRVRWIGYAPERELLALYREADLFVSMSTLEGFGLPVIEALASGAPTIVSDIAAHREIGGDAVTRVFPGDVNGLAAAMQDLLLNPAEAHGANARATRQQQAARFSWRETADTLWERLRTEIPSRRSHVMVPAPLNPAPKGWSSDEWALYGTVAYADMFDSPLSISAATRGTIAADFSALDVERVARGETLRRLLYLDERGFLSLADRAHLIDKVPSRQETTRTILDEASPTIRAFSRLPYVRALVLTGGLAYENPGVDPDVDFFVIAAADRAYTALTCLVLAARLTRRREQMCFNYVLDENELSIAYHRDLFTAQQIISARPLSGRTTYEAFLRANEDWLLGIFPGAHASDAERSAPNESVVQRCIEAALSPSAQLVENALSWAWRARLRNRISSKPQADVVLGRGVLKLHMSHYRARVLERFAARLDAIRSPHNQSSRRREADHAAQTP